MYEVVVYPDELAAGPEVISVKGLPSEQAASDLALLLYHGTQYRTIILFRSDIEVGYLCWQSDIEPHVVYWM